MDFTEARAAWNSDRAQHEAYGIYFSPQAEAYVADGFRANIGLAMDALPTTFTTNTSGIPAYLTTLIDPEVIRVLYAPVKAAEIYDEERRGTWTDDTATFSIVEQTGEVSSYGDWNNNGRAGINMNWPQRQSYLYQTIIEYGDRELERVGLAKLNYVAELEASAATVMQRFANYTYFYGVQGLQNYGILNDPGLGAALTPSTKAYGGVKWVNNGAVVSTANEVYADIQALFLQLVTQSGGLIDQDTPMVLVMSPQLSIAITATNSFNVSVTDLLKKNFPNIKIETAVQYGAQSATNPGGSVAGNIAQLIATSVEGQKTGILAYNERMREHPIVRDVSSAKKKITGGTWGFINRMPMAIAQMIGL